MPSTKPSNHPAKKAREKPKERVRMSATTPVTSTLATTAASTRRFFSKETAKAFFGSTIIGWLLGAGALLGVMYFMFIKDTNVRTETIADTNVIRTVHEHADTTSGLVGFIFPLAIALIVVILFAVAAKMHRTGERVVGMLVVAAIAAGLATWANHISGLNWEEVLHGVAAASLVILSAILAVLWDINRAHKADEKSQKRIDAANATWKTNWARLETQLRADGVDLNRVYRKW